jgi:hypothetical protein
MPAVDLDRYRRLRRRALVWTAVLSPVLAAHAVQFVVYLVDDDPRGAWIVFQGGVLGVLAGFWLVRLWNQARRSRPINRDADRRGGLELDDIPRRHPSITGQETYPTRW